MVELGDEAGVVDVCRHWGDGGAVVGWGGAPYSGTRCAVIAMVGVVAIIIIIVAVALRRCGSRAQKGCFKAISRGRGGHYHAGPAIHHSSGGELVISILIDDSCSRRSAAMLRRCRVAHLPSGAFQQPFNEGIVMAHQ